MNGGLDNILKICQTTSARFLTPDLKHIYAVSIISVSLFSIGSMMYSCKMKDLSKEYTFSESESIASSIAKPSKDLGEYLTKYVPNIIKELWD